MDLPYPSAPVNVPPGLARPGRRFRFQAWAAVAGLSLFLTCYFGLAAWFGWFGWQQMERFVKGQQAGADFLSGLAAFFLFAVMIKGLFFVRRGSAEGLVECSEAEEPALFEFVRRIAAEVGAPRPHRVFLSARVNAAVFYDLTLWNLLVPSKKNLEVGLGLVNALSLDEFKAVIAHEFGHFAQKTMTVGRWVHTAQQFVGDLIVRRDAFDRFLDGLSRFDLRLAWIGWILRLVIWSVRSLLDTMFRGVVALERALARQMEFQADLASVSVSGSDSIVHGLRKLEAADDAWEKAARFAIGEAQAGRPVADLLTVQSQIVERMREVLGDPAHGVTPEVPGDNAAQYRVFTSEIAQAPRMWASHPPNHEREENAKRVYVPSALDCRPAWVLFREGARLRAEMTRKLLEVMVETKLPEPVSLGDSLERIHAQFSRPHLDRRFRGAYLGRELTRQCDSVAALYGATSAVSQEEVIGMIDALYPASLADDLNHLRDLGQQRMALEGLRQGILSAPGGLIRFRGREVRRKDLASLVDQIEREHSALDGRVRAHDRTVRSAHRNAARLIGGRWEEYLVGLAVLLHYAEHTQARLEEARGHLAHLFALAVADRKVTKQELERLQAAGLDVLKILREIYRNRGDVRLPAPVAPSSGAETWAVMLPDRLELEAPSAEDVARGWLGALENHVQAYSAALGALRSRSLDALLEAEAQVARSIHDREDPGIAPEPSRAPESYTCLLAGAERPRREQLGWWERFQIADGPLPGAARFAAAAAILAPILIFSWTAVTCTIAVHNGLGIPVVVAIGRSTENVGAHETVRVSHRPGRVQVSATSHEGSEIEKFEAVIERSGTLVYNVASASALVELTATYGSRTGLPPRALGAGRWFETAADAVLEAPPESLRTRDGGAMLRVVQALDDQPPWDQIEALDVADQRRALALIHGRWDPLDHPDLAAWLELAAGQPGFEDILHSRLTGSPLSLAVRRVVMDHAMPATRSELCTGYARGAGEHPDDAGLLYLSIRCLEDGPEQDAAFLAAAHRFPGHMWLSWASYVSLSSRGDFLEALTMIEPLVRLEEVRRSLLGPRVASGFVRLRRLLAGRPEEADLRAAGVWLPTMESWLGPEKWATPPSEAPPYARATWHLIQGNLGMVLSTPGLSDEERSLLTLRIAHSEGAQPEQVQAGLQFPPGRLDNWYLVWPTAALVKREGGETSAIRKVVESQHQFTAAVWDALDPEQLRNNPSLLDAAVVGLPIELRGAVRMAGIVVLGDDAPEEWRREARGLLLPFERAYFRPPRHSLDLRQ